RAPRRSTPACSRRVACVFRRWVLGLGVLGALAVHARGGLGGSGHSTNWFSPAIAGLRLGLLAVSGRLVGFGRGLLGGLVHRGHEGANGPLLFLGTEGRVALH